MFYQHGVDSEGHPLVIYTPRLNNPKTRNVDELVRWTLYMVEFALSRLPSHLLQFTCLVNNVGMTHDTDMEYLKVWWSLCVYVFVCILR